jgi:uncharacterized glyoxalase superfamily protein PhnB
MHCPRSRIPVTTCCRSGSRLAWTTSVDDVEIEVRFEPAPVTHVPWLFVDDLDAHLEHARQHGAKILSEIRQHGYRCYEAEDLEGNKWVFAQARPTM